jgi:hypothetical protein
MVNEGFDSPPSTNKINNQYQLKPIQIEIMKLYYAIIDKTTTSDKYILGVEDELCQFWCYAQLYRTFEEAKRQIEHAKWDVWAEVVEVTTEML